LQARIDEIRFVFQSDGGKLTHPDNLPGDCLRLLKQGNDGLKVFAAKDGARPPFTIHLKLAINFYQTALVPARFLHHVNSRANVVSPENRVNRQVLLITLPSSSSPFFHNKHWYRNKSASCET